jgi:hypothetical protein
MSTTGRLTDLSLTEVFQFIEKGHRSGLLTIRVLPESPSMLPPVYYIWVDRGCLVAAANRLDQEGLVSLIKQHQWISKHVLARLDKFCPSDKPLGVCLKNQGALQAEQLKQLFYVQVLQLVFSLSQIKDGMFKFEPNVQIPTREMTGFSIPMVVLITLLEVVNDIQHIIDKLQSQSNYCVQKIIDQLQSQSKALQLLS